MRSIFITGANQGLGFCAATHLSATPNILLFIGSRKFQAAEEAISEFKVDTFSKVVPVQLDITDKTSVARSVETVKAALEKEGKEGLDVLVNNAGVAKGTFEDIFAVNVFGTASITAAMRPLLTKSKSSIINLSSNVSSSAFWSVNNPMFVRAIQTEHTPAELVHSYPASKCAVNGLTKSWATEAELYKTGVSVVSVCPGYNATALTDYRGRSDPMEGSKIIVQAALDESLTSPSFFNKDGPIAW